MVKRYYLVMTAVALNIVLSVVVVSHDFSMRSHKMDAAAELAATEVRQAAGNGQSCREPVASGGERERR